MTGASGSAARSRWSFGGVARVWTLTAVLAAASIAVYLLWVRDLEGLEERQIRFTGAVLLDALALTDANGGSMFGKKRVDKRRLSDTKLARHEDDLPLSGRRREINEIKESAQMA